MNPLMEQGGNEAQVAATQNLNQTLSQLIQALNANNANVIESFDSYASALTNFTSSLRKKNVTLANGTNNDIDIGNATFVRITGPTNNFSVSGFTGGYDGRTLILYNTTTGGTMTLSDDTGSSASNRILTLYGTDLVLSATEGSSAFLVYSADESRWIVISNKAT